MLVFIATLDRIWRPLRRTLMVRRKRKRASLIYVLVSAICGMACVVLYFSPPSVDSQSATLGGSLGTSARISYPSKMQSVVKAAENLLGGWTANPQKTLDVPELSYPPNSVESRPTTFHVHIDQNTVITPNVKNSITTSNVDKTSPHPTQPTISNLHDIMSPNFEEASGLFSPPMSPDIFSRPLHSDMLKRRSRHSVKRARDRCSPDLNTRMHFGGKAGTACRGRTGGANSVSFVSRMLERACTVDDESLHHGRLRGGIFQTMKRRVRRPKTVEEARCNSRKRVKVSEELRRELRPVPGC